MNDDLSPASAPRDITVPTVPSAPSYAPAAPGRGLAGRGLPLAVLLVTLLSIIAIVFAWRADQRVRSSERELVQRQQDSAGQVAEANLLSRQAQESAREAVAKAALLEARLNEIAVQRTQLEALVQSVARSRDENLVRDGEATLRAGLQQASLTGSAEPLVAALKQLDDRLDHADQPRLEPVRRAIARDLERVKAANVADVATLSIKLDEASRMVDELPLLSAAEPRRDLGRAGAPTGQAAAAAATPASAAASGADAGIGAWLAQHIGTAGAFLAGSAWSELRSLVRITRIDQPEAMLVAPDQAFFLKENLKLRLLNARLSLMARQFDAAQGDLRWAQGTIDRYFDRSSKRTQGVSELLRQVEQQARQSPAARPDDTLAALAAVAGAR
ncbi:MAG: uroporphyrinogen-III C-methyltransferase [Caldimonas sp.]